MNLFACLRLVVRRWGRSAGGPRWWRRIWRTPRPAQRAGRSLSAANAGVPGPAHAAFPAAAAGLRRAAPGWRVRVERVVADMSPLPRRYQPGHPDVDDAGYATYPNVNPVMEMADLLSAVRAYQLNAAAVQAAKSMIQQSLQILT